MRKGEERHTQRFSRRYPGLFIILLDQSGSMAEPVEGKKFTKAAWATSTLNTIIYEMIKVSGKDENGDRPLYMYLSIFGYNNDVYPLLPIPQHIPFEIVPLPYLAENITGYATASFEVPNRSGKREIRDEKRPYWIKPHATGRTEMRMAFEVARDIVLRWYNTAPEPNQAPRQKCFPPIIINITDGNDTGEEGTIDVVREIQRMETPEGEPLIFNCHFTKDKTQPCIFPVDKSEVLHLEHFASHLFEMSSVIPDALRTNASATMGNAVRPGARCFVYNANPEILVKFLRWGTVRLGVRTAPPNN